MLAPRHVQTATRRSALCHIGTTMTTSLNQNHRSRPARGLQIAIILLAALATAFPASAQVGECCAGGECVLGVTPAECSDLVGVWGEPGTRCMPIQGIDVCAALFACCLPDGTCRSMTPLEEANCQAAGGQYLEGEFCDAADCAPPTDGRPRACGMGALTALALTSTLLITARSRRRL